MTRGLKPVINRQRQSPMSSGRLVSVNWPPRTHDATYIGRRGWAGRGWLATLPGDGAHQMNATFLSNWRHLAAAPFGNLICNFKKVKI